MTKKSGCQHRVKGKTHYERNKQYYIDKALAQKRKIREFIRDSKDVPCADCGESYPHYVMDFDHRPDEKKLFGIASAYNRHAMAKVVAEVAKCDVVCSNCHRERTHKRGQNSP